MGSSSSSSGAFGGFSSYGSGNTSGHAEQKEEVKVTLEDLDLPPRRDLNLAAAAALQKMAAAQGGGVVPGAAPGAAGGGASGAAAVPAISITEEIFHGGDPSGQKAFREDGLVGTEGQQLQLLAYYAELCEDFRNYQRGTRAEGAARESDGAQLLLLSGAPGTGKTRHAVSFAKAVGLPLLLADPLAGAGTSASGSTWAARLRREVRGRDCVVFFDEIDRHTSDEAFASELRQLLDGVCQPVGSRVLLVGTTNRLDRLPDDVVHRAEVIRFDRPEAPHLAEMWRSHATHLPEKDIGSLAEASRHGGLTGRDVRHCASWAERHTAINYLNSQNGMGYCHGTALGNCKGPLLEKYLQCVKTRVR